MCFLKTTCRSKLEETLNWILRFSHPAFKSEGKLDLNARITAALHAAIVFVMSAYVIAIDEQFDWRDVYTSVCVFAMTTIKISQL